MHLTSEPQIRKRSETNPYHFREFCDPVDGKPGEIDRESQIIRCCGFTMKADPPDPTSPPPAKAGYFSLGDVQLPIVRRWKPTK